MLEASCKLHQHIPKDYCISALSSLLSQAVPNGADLPPFTSGTEGITGINTAEKLTSPPGRDIKLWDWECNVLECDAMQSSQRAVTYSHFLANIEF
jgi:hypothetical protein